MSSSRALVLESAAATIVKNLGGRWRDGGAMCRCPAHDDRTPSLSVRIGDRSLLLKCFAGCTATEVLRAIRRRKLDIPTVASPDIHSQIDDHDTSGSARRIWDMASSIRGTLGERYLRSRGIDIPTPALRYCPRTPVGRGRNVRFRPAIIAPVHMERRLVSVQRIFLDPATCGLATDMERPRLALGRPLSGAVRLWPAGTMLGLAEGIETALSAAILLDIPVWAVLGNERLPRTAVPDTIDRLVLLPDADRPGRRSARLAEQAYALPGRSVDTILPWYGLNDWNDVLMHGPPAGRRLTLLDHPDS